MIKRVAFVLALWTWAELAIATVPALPSQEAPMVVTVQLLAPPGTDLSGLDELLAQSPGLPLSRSAVRRTIQLLDETGRFENVLAYTQPMAGGVALLVQLIPRLRLTGIGFHGNNQLSDDFLREKSGLHAGDEFVRERVQAAAVALTEAYQHAGFPSAQITWDSSQSNTQARVEFEVDEGQPLRAEKVEITGRPALSLDLLQHALGFEVGAIVDADALDEGVLRLARLFRKNGRYAAKVGPANVTRIDGEHADVEIPVMSGPAYRLVLLGNHTFTDHQLHKILDYDGQEAFDDSILARLAERLRDFYRHQGFLFATVQPRVVPRGGVDDIVFEIDEGRPYRVTRLELRGIDELDRQKLTDEFRASVRIEPDDPFFGFPEAAEIDAVGVSGRPVVPGPSDYRADPDVYVAEVYAQALARLSDRYREEGFLSIHIAPPQLDIDLERHEIAVTIAVQEGPRARIQRLEFIGNERLQDQDLAPLTGLKVGDPLAKSALERSRKALVAALDQKGLPFARVVADQQIDDAGELGVLRYHVHEGPEVRIGRILFRGNVHTRDGFLHKNVDLLTGQRYDPEAITRSQQRLQQLGVFDQVQISLLEPEIAEPIKDLLVTVHERHPESIVPGIGYSYIEGPRLSIEYTHHNLFGEAVQLQIQTKVNYFPWSILALTNPGGSLELQGLPPAEALQGKDNGFGFGGQVDAVVTDPRLFRIGNTADGVLRLELLAERIDRPYYAFGRAALLPGIQLVLSRRLTFGFQTDFEVDNIDTYGENLTEIFNVLSVADFQNLRFPPGWGWMGSLGPSIGYDMRDNPVNPRSGFAATVKGSWVAGLYYPCTSCAANSIFSGTIPTPEGTNAPLPIDLFSVSGTVSGYLPVGPVVFALQIKGGRIFPVGDTFVIPTQRFFLGGPDSDRGFQMDMMLPQDYRVELHHEVSLCNQTATGGSCSLGASILRGGSQLPSPGGEVFEDIRGEARFPLFAKILQGAVFIDAGNLWSDPGQFDLFTVRPAAGVGVRFPSPIGSLAFDVGFNLDPDWIVNEQIPQPFLSIGLF